MAKMSQQERDAFTCAYRFYEKYSTQPRINLEAALNDYTAYCDTPGGAPRIGVLLMSSVLDCLTLMAGEQKGRSDSNAAG